MSIQGIVPLLKFLEEHKEWGREEFLQRYSYPFFLYPGDQEKGAPKIAFPQMIEDSPIPKRNKLKTMRMVVSDLEDTLPPSFRRVIIEKALVIPLPFRQSEKGVVLLEIGRDTSMDLYFDDEQVSAHHATIIGEGDPLVYKIIDQGSTNETYVDGTALPPGKITELQDGCTLEFGLHRLFVFYYPETLYKCLNMI
ncbi:MAG: FHA domain-containing protein [Planctomycetota bacterium]|nr:MAG: FHA domain-containing protein [Planctomycetota bacterium]